MEKDNFQNKIGWILQEKYDGKLTKDAKADIERLKKGEPLDYIIGFTNFLGYKIDLSQKTLIPRVETEFWVGEVIEEIKNNYPPQTTNYKLHILDMFSGSGCIGISVMRHIKNSSLVFVDSEDNAILQIKVNCKVNKISKNKHKIIKSDVFSNIIGNFDYIFANPPYIPVKRKDKIQASVLKYEPKESLFGGYDGMLYIERFLLEAKDFLNKNGKIYMEFDPHQKPKIEKIILKNNYSKYEFHKDQYGKWRYVMIIFD